MKVEHHSQSPSQVVDLEGAAGCQVRWLVGEKDDAPTFAMRQFEIAPGGHTPKHFHPYEHEVYVLGGTGVVLDGDEPKPISAGDVLYIAPDEIHQFRNTGDGALQFLCLIPNTATGKEITTVPECGIES